MMVSNKSQTVSVIKHEGRYSIGYRPTGKHGWVMFRQYDRRVQRLIDKIVAKKRYRDLWNLCDIEARLKGP